MKLATDKSHRDYFYKHGTIEFDGLFPLEQIQQLNTAIDGLLSLTFKNIAPQSQNTENVFLCGRDLYRKDERIKKQVLNRRLAEIAQELMEARGLRIGYDQLLVGQSGQANVNTDALYNQFLQSVGSLQDKSCVQPLVCGLVICLQPSSSLEIPPVILPQTLGNGVFFKPDLPLDLSYLSHAQGGRYLMIAYAKPRSIYVLNDKDPHTHSLKHRGYVFGDRLSDKLNSLIIRN
ncbi:hypothetical protein DB41_CR00050 [Neochlamydia sp. TUME1]|uniref:hypothetical protein n=1 Tax=Neochlamydia sp. TUME1 TaxID=1478174 RepID=UPI0005807729|nr:hypothetical protein [Neochlamydia sp. TUME1]KIC77211.1 hypothetical protein DB41_CR00050 [Neochlamydia sp. TUME1]